MAYQEYELCIFGVPAKLLSYVRRMCDVCKYELRIEEYELRMLRYVRDVRVTYLSYDTRVDTQ